MEEHGALLIRLKLQAAGCKSGHFQASDFTASTYIPRHVWMSGVFIIIIINLELLQQRNPKPTDKKSHQKGLYCDEKWDYFLADCKCWKVKAMSRI